VVSIAHAQREFEEAAAYRVSDLETKLAADDFELALTNLRAEAESLSRSKNASAQQLVERQSR
jgi:hypothetical protein